MTYKKGGRVPDSFGAGKKFVSEIAEVAQVPGGLEMLMTMAAEELGVDKGQTKAVRMYNMGDGSAPRGYAQGGLSQYGDEPPQQHSGLGQIMAQAEGTRQAGRGDDSMIVHMAPEEYQAITSMWGEPDINPDTGMPEYGFLSKIWKGIKNTVKKIVKSPLFGFLAPIALNIFAPGLGSAVGGWLGATGKAASVIGNTLVQSGVGAITGGKDGAISGALSGLVGGGVGGDIGKKLGIDSTKLAKYAGDAILGGVAGEATGVGFGQGALGQTMQTLSGNPAQKFQDKLTGMGQEAFGTTGGGISGRGIVAGDDPMGMMSPVPEGSMMDPFGVAGLGSPPGGPMSPVPQGAPTDTTLGNIGGGSPWSKATDWMKEHPWLTAGGALGIAAMAGQGGGDEGPPGRIDTGTNFYDSLPNLSFDRTAMPAQDYYNYGRSSAESPGEQMFFQGNSISGLPPAPPGIGPGGGGGGRGGRGGRRGSGGGPGAEGLPTEGNFLPGLGPGEVGGQISSDALHILSKGPLDRGHIWRMAQEAVLKKYYPGMSYDDYFAQNQYGAAMGGYVNEYALGGLVRKYQTGGHVRGPGSGRSDEIPAVLSDGEYVMDSETVALLGDGSTDAGARRLDEMRENLRKHKAKKLAKGRFSHAAKKPEQYLKKAEGGSIPEGTSSALKELKRFGNRLEQAITSGNKKRVAEITAQLQSLKGGDKVIQGLAKGGSVKRIIEDLERTVESDYRGIVEGKVEKRLRDRRQRERKESQGRRASKLSDKEKAKLAEELGGFRPDSAFIKRFKADLKKAKAEEK